MVTPTITATRVFNDDERSAFQITSFLHSLDIQFGIKDMTDDHQKIFYLDANLGDKALDCYYSFLEAQGDDEMVKMTYRTFCEYFRIHFTCR